MKKFLTLMFVAFPLMTGWGGEAVTERTIVASFYPIRIALLNIVGTVEGVGVVSLAEPDAGCLHHYHLTTRDMALLSKADVVVVNGAGLESFHGDLLRKRTGLKIIDACSGLDLLVDRAATNAHVWVSPTRHIRQIQRIADGLAQWDPVNAGAYRKNADAYTRRIETLKAAMSSRLAQVRHHKIITFHEAFSYFADEFNLEVVGCIEREPGSAPSASEMAALIQLIRTSGVKALCVEPQYPDKVARVIARETGAGIYTLDPVVSGPVSTNAYIEIMQRNLTELERALQ